MPDILVPYKRHESLSIEAAVSEPPADHVGIEESTLRADGTDLVIGERTRKRPRLLDHLQPRPAESSRLLEAAHERHRERQERQIPAVSYRKVPKGEPGDV